MGSRPAPARLPDRLLDTAGELRRKQRAVMAATRAAAAARKKAAPLAAPPPPGSPVLVIPAARVVTATGLAVLVVAWGWETWVPKSAIANADVDSLLSGWSGPLEVSSWWAQKVGLQAPKKAARRPRSKR